MNNKNHNTLIYLLFCLIFLLVICFIYCNYAKERKIFIQEAVNDFEKNTLLTISNFSLMHSQTNFNLENNIKEYLDEAVKPHFDLLKSIIKDGSDFGINTVSFWLAFLSLIMIIFTILGIFANNKILEVNEKKSELSIEKLELKIEKVFKDLKIKEDEIEKQTKQSAENANKAKVSELFSRALEEYRKENIDEAINLYNELLKLDENNFEALYNSGNLYNIKYSNIEEKEYFDLALNNYNKALNISKNDLDTLINRSILYRKKYTYTKDEEYFNLALNDYNKVLNMEYNNLNALINIGWLYLVNYSISKNIVSLNNAEKYIEKTLSIDNSNLHLLNNKGIMLLFQYRIEKDIKILEEAEKYLNRAISDKREKHDLGETYYYLSLVYKEYSQLEDIDNIKKEEYKNKSEEALKKSKELGYENFIED